VQELQNILLGTFREGNEYTLESAKISIERLMQFHWKYQDIYNFSCSIQPYKNQVKVLTVKILRKLNIYMDSTGGPRDHISCEHHSATKTHRLTVKIAGYM